MEPAPKLPPGVFSADYENFINKTYVFIIIVVSIIIIYFLKQSTSSCMN